MLCVEATLIFNNLYNVKRFLEKASISSIWCLRLQGRYTVKTSCGVIEIQLNAKGKNIVHFSSRHETEADKCGNVTYGEVVTISSEMNSHGYEGIRQWLDKKIAELN